MISSLGLIWGLGITAASSAIAFGLLLWKFDPQATGTLGLVLFLGPDIHDQLAQDIESSRGLVVFYLPTACHSRGGGNDKRRFCLPEGPRGYFDVTQRIFCINTKVSPRFLGETRF